MKNEKYQAPLNIYISSSYDDAELAQKFLSDYVKGFGITVDKQRNGDELYVTIDGLDEDIDALVSVYTAQYDEFKKDCKAEPSGWVSPVNFEKSKEDESMKSESNIEDLRDQTISWGTMRSEDLIPKFLGVLKTYAKDKYDEYVNENPEVLDIDGLDDETLGWIVDELFDELDKIAPEGTYFGAHPDDGADYGFWSVEQYESKKNENRTKEEEITNIFKGMKDWASKYPNDPDRKIIADNLDLDAVQDNMSDIVEVMDKAFEWDGYDYMYPVKDYGDDDDARDEAEASQWDACYSVCEEIADIIGVPDEGHSIGEMNIYFWEEIEQTFTSEESANKTEAKKSKSTENTTESERISFIKDLANKLGIDNLKENRASAYMSGWRYFNNDDEGGDGIVLNLKAYPWARNDQYATIDVWLETASGVIDDCWLSFDFGGNYKNSINADKILTTLKTQLHTLWSRHEGVAKKSESLTLKQAELKKMAKYGEAEDITGLSDAEAKELKKSGVELVGISRGTYGMNGALMRGTADGKLYVITSRNSNLFYFV